MAKGGEAKKSEGTAKAMLSQLANGGEATNKYDQYFMDLTADAGKLRTQDEDAFYALTERELGSFKGKYGNELQGAYGNRRLLGTDPETGRNVYVAELVADDLRNWGMSRGQRPSLQRLEIQGPRGYFETHMLPTASDYAAQGAISRRTCCQPRLIMRQWKSMGFYRLPEAMTLSTQVVGSENT
jgi:hypothetical protein